MANKIAIGRFRRRIIRIKDKEYNEYSIHIPREFAEEEDFPFKPKEAVIIIKEKDGLHIKRINVGV